MSHIWASSADVCSTLGRSRRSKPDVERILPRDGFAQVSAGWGWPWREEGPEIFFHPVQEPVAKRPRPGLAFGGKNVTIFTLGKKNG